MIPQDTNRGWVLNLRQCRLGRLGVLLVSMLVLVGYLAVPPAAGQDRPGTGRRARPPVEPVQQDPPKETEKEAEPDDPSKEVRRVEDELDPETLRKIDELLQQEREELKRRGKTPARSTPRTPERLDPKPRTTSPVTIEPAAPAPTKPDTPTPRSRRTPRPEGEPELTATPKMTPAPAEEPEQPVEEEKEAEAAPAPVLPDQSDVPFEERVYSFSIDGTYEDLVEGFSRQTGLGVLGDIPSGKVRFISTEMMDYQEALGRIRMLLFNYKPLDRYWLWFNNDHLEVIRVPDFYRVLPREQMFRSVEEFRAAGLPDNELALVIYTPKSGSVSDLERVRDFMPDYARIAPLEDSNAMTIYALVSDIEKYLELIDFFTGSGSDDPRTLTTIKLEYVLPGTAVSKLQTLMELDEDGSTPSGRRRAGRSAAKTGEVSEPPVSLLPDDAQGLIIVRAMQDKIDEINLLLPYIDVDTGVDNDVVLIPVEHVDPAVLVTKIQTVLSAAEGKMIALPSAKSPRRRGKDNAPAPTTISLGTEIAMFPMAEAGAIAVVGSEEDVERVRELVAKFDVTNEVGPFRVVLENADPAEVAMTVLQVFEGGAGGKAPKTSTSNVRVVAEPNGDAVWVSGPEREVDEIMDIIETLDAEDDPVILHVARLLHQTPSFVANILKQYEGGPAPGGGQAHERADR